MNKIYDVQIEQIIKDRTSVRTYQKKALPQEIKNNITQYISTLSNPFGICIGFKLLELKAADNYMKLGTYGVISGAADYIGATVKPSEFALLALGYTFEKLILYITSLGLSSCWLGGTFKKGEFAKAMQVKKDEIFPVVSPIGYSADKKSLADSIVRYVAKSNQRKPWEVLFFDTDFGNPLQKSAAAQYEAPLEMLRFAPSASNKQPWRVVKKDNIYHFYEAKTPGYSKAFEHDVQKIDVGIAICHFHLTAIENGLNGEFKKLDKPPIALSENVEYIISWVVQ